MPSEDLILQELKHGGAQGLRHTVYLVEKQDSLTDTALFNGLVYRGYDLTHGIFGDGIFLSAKGLLRDIGKSKCRLPCMMGH